MEKENSKCFHFIAIGGVGQSALAKILAIQGYKVTGSDIVQSKYTSMLEKLGVKISIGHKKENVNENQIIVLSSAIKEDNPELIRAKELNLKLYHRSDVLKLISEEYEHFIGFSGTHGKTTTSGLASYVLEKIGAHPAYAAGGMIDGLETNSNAYRDSKVFVAELDESDGTIVKYSPDYLVINNLEVDHFDFYKSGETDLIKQFYKFFENLKEGAHVFLNTDDAGIQHFLKTINSKNVLTYSIKDSSKDYFADNIKITGDGNSFDLYREKKFLGTVKTKIKGVHNVYNTLAVCAVLIECGFKLDDLLPHLYSFLGMRRRFEKVYDGKITVIDDYAHHPTEIKATLNCAKKQTKNNIVAIFQPHRYTRLKALWNEFLNSFDLADEVFVVEAYSAGDPFDEEFNSENFANAMKNKNVKYVKGNMDNAAVEISKLLKENDYVITIGAGDVTKIGHSLGRHYEERRN